MDAWSSTRALYPLVHVPPSGTWRFHGEAQLTHVNLYDGTIEDEHNYAAMGGQSDEIRRFNFMQGGAIPCYAAADVWESIRRIWVTLRFSV